MCACVCVCVRAFVRACVRAWVGGGSCSFYLIEDGKHHFDVPILEDWLGKKEKTNGLPKAKSSPTFPKCELLL